MKLLKVSLVILGLGLVILSKANWSVFSPSQKVVIGTNNWLGYRPLHVGYQVGFLNKEKFHLVELGSNTSVVSAFRKGDVDIAALTLDEVLLLAETELDAVIFLILDYSFGADAIVAQPEYTSFEQLKGKRIGLESTALGAFFFSLAMDFYKMKEKDFKFFHSTFDFHYKDFKEKKVDAIVTFHPVKEKLVKLGGNILFDSRQAPGAVLDVLVVRKSKITELKDELQYITDRWFAMVDKIKEKDAAFMREFAIQSTLSRDSLEASLKELVFPKRAEDRKLLTDAENGLVSKLRMLQAIMLRKGLLSKKLDVHSLVTSQFIGEGND